MNDYLKLEYWNDCNIEIYYENGFRQGLYIPSELIAPKWNIEEEGVEDGDKEFVSTFGKVKKDYRMEFIVPEYLVQALSFAQIHDNIELVRRTGERSRLIDMRVSSKPIFRDCYYNVEMILSVDFVISRCCEDKKCFEVNHNGIDGRYDYDSNQWNNPQDVPVPNGRRYLFYKVGTEYEGSIYTFDRGRNEWIIESQLLGDMVEFGEITLIYDGVWRDLPSCEQDGNDLKGYAVGFSFVQLQEKQVGVWVDVEEPVLDGVFTGVGIDISGYIGSEVRVHCYNHSCDYGYSESVNLV